MTPYVQIQATTATRPAGSVERLGAGGGDSFGIGFALGLREG